MWKSEEIASTTVKLSVKLLSLLKNSSKLQEMLDQYFLHSLISDDDQLIVSGSDASILSFQTQIEGFEKSIKDVVLSSFILTESETRRFFRHKNMLKDLEKVVMQEIYECALFTINDDGELCACVLNADVVEKVTGFLNSYITRTEFDLDEEKLKLFTGNIWSSYFWTLEQNFGDAITWSRTDTKLTLIGYSKDEHDLKQLMGRFWNGLWSRAFFKYISVSSVIAEVLQKFASIELFKIYISAAKSEIEIKLVTKVDGENSDFVLRGDLDFMPPYIKELRDLCKKVIKKTVVITTLAYKVIIKNVEEIAASVSRKQHNVALPYPILMKEAESNNNHIQMDIYSTNEDNITNALKDVFKSLVEINRVKVYN
ncbi:hypothetical protein HELRODRAFT_161430 [Helobdella robusta]|uniref:Uncharacterized protein n=1 Tax=Helobdella robusta TaxID=6412 RepID=T1ERG6_HELRO|nr:hypothetical protein HELRODRAFT_161430 [Helobdella robusta]ESO02189.1 hypothetical protein HELRODRAFT_161430 [Helobdella robusta]